MKRMVAVSTFERTARDGSGATTERIVRGQEFDATEEEARLYDRESNPLARPVGSAEAKEAEEQTDGGLQGLAFASDEAEQAARDAGLTAADFEGVKASGAGGYTKADVTKVAGKEKE